MCSMHFDYDGDHCQHVVRYYFEQAHELEAYILSDKFKLMHWPEHMKHKMANVVQACYYRGGVYSTMVKPHFDFDRREFPQLSSCW